MEDIPEAICNEKPLLMNKAYEDNACRKKTRKLKMKPVVPPKSYRKKPWRYNKKLYKSRNTVEHYFRNAEMFFLQF